VTYLFDFKKFKFLDLFVKSRQHKIPPKSVQMKPNFFMRTDMTK